MSTKPRRLSESGIYHITQRGVGRGIIYEDNDDRRVYLKLLQRIKRRYGFELYAYCLMGNHNHLLMRFENTSMSHAMRDLGSSYASYFNEKYDRVGHLFEKRYGSKPVESESHALCAVRYILQNPARCGLAESQDYPWSSYSDYVNTSPQGQGVHGLTDTAAMLGELGSGRQFKEFVETFDEADSKRFASWRRRGTIDDAEASVMVANLLGVSNSMDVSGYDLSRRNTAVKQLSGLGLSPSQLARVTGLNRSAIYRALK